MAQRTATLVLPLPLLLLLPPPRTVTKRQAVALWLLVLEWCLGWCRMHTRWPLGQCMAPR